MSGWFDDETSAESEPTSEAREQGGGDRDPTRDGHRDPGGRDTHDRADSGAETADSSGGARERYRVKGDELLAKVKQIVREGNVRKITIRKEDDEVLLSFPLAAGVIGAALLPMWAAIGAVAALVGNCSIDVERRE